VLWFIRYLWRGEGLVGLNGKWWNGLAFVIGGGVICLFYLCAPSVLALDQQGKTGMSIPQNIGGVYPTDEKNILLPGKEESGREVFWGYLRLVGVLAGGLNPAKNRAVVEDVLTGCQKVYGLGAFTPYGVKIAWIGKAEVVLEKVGRRKRLKVGEMVGGAEKLQIARRCLRLKGYEKVSEDEWLVTPNRLLKSTKYIGELLKRARLKPVFEAGEWRGVQVGNRPQGVLAELGLEAGDVVARVNGLKVDGVARAFEVYQQIRYEPSIVLEVWRDGKQKDLVYYVVPDGPPKYDIFKVLRSDRIAELFSLGGGL